MNGPWALDKPSAQHFPLASVTFDSSSTHPTRPPALWLRLVSCVFGGSFALEAVSYHRHGKGGNKTVTVLLLDEVGLAEHSPLMPLKVLHTILVEEEVAVVGLSNWVLDPAKMNRAILLQRPDASQAEMANTGGTIVLEAGAAAAAAPKPSPNEGGAAEDTPAVVVAESVPSGLAAQLEPLARAYHEVYTDQGERDFIGMRDYYSLLKLLRRSLLAGAAAADGARGERGMGWGGDVFLVDICEHIVNICYMCFLF